jgi:hypothetical protein
MRKTCLLFFTCLYYSAWGQIDRYNINSVPEKLKANASVIIHLENIEVEVESLEKTNVKTKKIYTVLNEEGKDALVFQQYINKFLSLDDVDIKVYDDKGRQTARYKKKDLATTSVGEGLIEEGFVSYLPLSTPSYPVTIELNYEQKFKSTLSFPDFRFIHPKEAVIESNYTAKVPADIPLRYQSKHIALEPVIAEEGKNKIYKWSVKNLPPLENEDGSVSAHERFPYVNIVPQQFAHYSYRGDLSTWKTFGGWINELYKGLDELPLDRQQFFTQMVKDLSDPTEKAKRIYSYLQKNFRYVSIQLGIGGLKPFSASFTDQKKYGDCKALSNYMKAALKTVGIESHVAIINAGYDSEPVDAAFPANNFNHVILCIPNKKDSLWLECTSNTIEFGTLGTNTENRNALLITDKGGVLVPTPKSNYTNNYLGTNTTIQLQDDLSAITETTITTKGDYAEMIADVLDEKKDDQKKFIVYYLGHKQPDDFELMKEENRVILKSSIRKVSEFNAGSKHFFSPRITKVWVSKLPSADKRKMDFYFYSPFEKRDTTIIKLSTAYKSESLPAEKEIKNNYGYYHTRSWYQEKENSVYTATILILKTHKIPASDYKQVKTFFDEVIQDDTQRIVLLKTANATTDKKAF